MANPFKRAYNAMFGSAPPVTIAVEDKILPSVRAIKKQFQPNAPTTRTKFNTPASGNNNQHPVQDYDLSIIDRFADNESIIFQTFSKIEEKATNNGWQILSKDQEALDYIRRRFLEFAHVTKKPISLFIRETLQDLIKYSNCFLYKFRDPDNSTGKTVVIAGKDYEPICAYIRLDPTSVIPERDKDGNIKRYLVGPTNQGQYVLDQFKKVPPEDIVHIYAFKSERNNLGTPYVHPVIDDVRVLRHMEENLELLIHKHLFPLYQYIIGTEDHEAEPEELEKITIDIENLPTEGGWVTPSRHKIVALGAEGRAMVIDKYLNYFRERVVMGLGIGLVSFGLGSGGSRASAEVIDRNLVEKAKLYQRLHAAWFNDIIIPELLYEAGWDIFDSTAQVPEVKLEFNEIDSDTKVKLETHATNLFNSQGIDFDEYRARLGEDIKEESDFNKLQWNLFGGRALAELEKETGVALERAKGSTDKASGAASASRAANGPSNQHGTKLSPKRQRDEIEDSKNTIKTIKNSSKASELNSKLTATWDATREDLVAAVQAGKVIETDKGSFNLVFGVTESTLYNTSRGYIADAFDMGYLSASPAGVVTDNTIRLKANEVLDKHSELLKKTVTELKNDVINILVNKKVTVEELPNTISSVFDIRKHYVTRAVDTGISKAFNYGRVHSFKDQGYKAAEIVCNDSGCSTCLKEAGRKIDISHPTVDSIPPHHTSCECSINAVAEDA